MAEEMGPEPLKNLPTIFFSIFGSSVSAGWPDKAAKAHRAISTLSLDASNLAYLSRYSKLIYEHSKLYTAHLCRLLVQCVHRTVQWVSHHFQPMTKSSHSASWLHGFTQSTPTADIDILWLHKGLHSQDCLLIIICEPCNSHYCSPVNHSKLLRKICCSALPISHHLLLMSWQLIETDMRFSKH